MKKVELTVGAVLELDSYIKKDSGDKTIVNKNNPKPLSILKRYFYAG